MMSHIFVSYAHEDKDCCDKVIKNLLQAGFPVWQDTFSLRTGDNWVSMIRKGTSQASAFIVLWSKHAAVSKYVKKEIEMMLNRYVMDKTPIFQLLLDDLDDTPLHQDLREFQAYNLLECADIRTVLTHIAEKVGFLRWQMTDFDPERTLEEQGAEPMPKVKPLLQYPLLTSGSGECKAYAVGLPDESVINRETIQVCLRFSQRSSIPFLSSVLETVQHYSPKSGFFGVYIEGPFDSLSDRYWMDNDNTSLWSEAVFTIRKALEVVVNEQHVILQVFTASPQALVFGLGLQLFKFTHLELYNYEEGSKKAPFYKPVLSTSTLRL
jgi:hypothetical protein